MIKLINLSKRYEEKIIFDHFSLEIPTNQITCILGESGVGKTTLLNMIAGVTPYQGTIEAPKKISYIFQEARLIPNLTVKENLKFVSKLSSDEEIMKLLSILEIEDKVDTYPNKLSGGETQRVAIARAFLYDGDLILMDEPFSSLDLSLKYRLIQYFSTLWNQKPKTVLFVTHSIEEAILLADTILYLQNGKIEKSYSLDTPLPRQLTDNEDIRKKILQDIIK